jgi:hypothetical protein
MAAPTVYAESVVKTIARCFERQGFRVSDFEIRYLGKIPGYFRFDANLYLGEEEVANIHGDFGPRPMNGYSVSIYVYVQGRITDISKRSRCRTGRPKIRAWAAGAAKATLKEVTEHHSPSVREIMES